MEVEKKRRRKNGEKAGRLAGEMIGGIAKARAGHTAKYDQLMKMIALIRRTNTASTSDQALSTRLMQEKKSINCLGQTSPRGDPFRAGETPSRVCRNRL